MKTILDKIDKYIEEEKEVGIETESEVMHGVIQSRGIDYIEFKKITPTERRGDIYIFPLVRIMSISMEE